jgi:hypothetical protein
LAAANALACGVCGLTDGSTTGDWRLPSVSELESLIDFERVSPALSNAADNCHRAEGDALPEVQSDYYWSSTSHIEGANTAWNMHLYHGFVNMNNKSSSCYVWTVRRGR